MNKLNTFCNTLLHYKRRETVEVKVGDIPLGNKNEIRVQSMTSADTLDTNACVEQSVKMIQAGAKYIRITAQSPKHAENLKNIKQQLVTKGYTNPVVADIHFNPEAAMIAAKYVDKVRINPGNFVDRRAVFKTLEYTNQEYAEELLKIEEKLIPLLTICKEKNTALRIGTNHGSLSDRIMSRYGNTPEGMCEATLEFLRVCVKQDFLNVVISIKSSNTPIMVKTVRLLVKKMNEENMNFPFHLGVTEAGEGEDGRIKSICGISSLLLDGIGDTVRISLTEDPENEPPVAYAMLNNIVKKEIVNCIHSVNDKVYDLTKFEKRKINNHSNEFKNPIVVSSADTINEINKSDFKADYYYTSNIDLICNEHAQKFIIEYDKWKENKYANSFPIISINELEIINSIKDRLVFIKVDENTYNEDLLKHLSTQTNSVFVLESDTNVPFYFFRAFAYKLMEYSNVSPIVHKQKSKVKTEEEFMIVSSNNYGALFIDNLSNGIWLDNTSIKNNIKISTSFSILQACSARISKAEFVSCPSCGRTLYNIQDTIKKIKQNFSHLTGIKIGVMGCIVNGPGEMGDVDYGYVGTVPGKIALYKGQTMVKKNVLEEDAVDELKKIMKNDGIDI